VTDLFSYLGVPIKNGNLVQGDLLNFKITTKEDLVILQQIQLPLK
jgi:2-C-methyl-D-erythritol 4-phosphate cytidylyltransferase